MAHFAKVDANNVVERVEVVGNDIITDPNTNQESEQLGIEFLRSLYGEDTNWVQTSYNKNFRGLYAAPGMTYYSDLDVFLPPQPYPSWTLDTTEKAWVAPLPMPTADTGWYEWDEDAYQANNTTGWVYRTFA